MMNYETSTNNPLEAGIISFKNIKAGFMPFKEQPQNIIANSNINSKISMNNTKNSVIRS